MKRLLNTRMLLVGVGLVVAVTGYVSVAGPLDPPPGGVASTGRTLQEVYDEIHALRVSQTWNTVKFTAPPSSFVELAPPGSSGVLHTMQFRSDGNYAYALYLEDATGAETFLLIRTDDPDAHNYTLDMDFTNGLRFRNPGPSAVGRGFVTLRINP